MSETTRSGNLVQASLPVQGMTCAACVAKVEKTLKSIAGVQEVHVNLPAEFAKVSHLFRVGRFTYGFHRFRPLSGSAHPGPDFGIHSQADELTGQNSPGHP